MYLQPPLLDDANVACVTTCIRPKRAGGFCLEIQQNSDRSVIVHNYGHGSSGWTLLPATVFKALQLFDQHCAMHRQVPTTVTVLGAGCVGLFTAYQLAKRGFKVTLLAESFQDLTSHKAGGYFVPFPFLVSRRKQKILNALHRTAFLYYQQQVVGKQPEFTAVSYLPMYRLLKNSWPQRFPLIEMGLLPEPETVSFNFGNGVAYDNGVHYTTLFIDTQAMMQQLHAKLKALGVVMVQKKVTSLQDVQTEYLFNCVGLGARGLGETAMLPVQGHLISFSRQPTNALRYAVHTQITVNGVKGSVHWLPKNGGTLGASFVNGDGMLPQQNIYEQLLERARYFFYG